MLHLIELAIAAFDPIAPFTIANMASIGLLPCIVINIDAINKTIIKDNK
jgi:hypothetical protein